jgi:hypothetical protein
MTQAQARRFAEDTGVTAAKSRDQIVEMMKRAGADAFLFGEDKGRATIGFRLEGRYLRFTVPIPERGPRGGEQLVRTRWRALWLVVKARLEAVAIGLTTIEEAFLAETILPDKHSVAEVMLPQIEAAYRDGKMPPLLPYYGDDR